MTDKNQNNRFVGEYEIEIGQSPPPNKEDIALVEEQNKKMKKL
jgi:hypothetical protein